MFTFDRKVTYSEVSADNKVSAAQIVRYFQDCSIMQSESLGVGVDYLAQQHKVWLLASWQIRFLRRPKLGEMLHTCTWPYAFETIYGYRNFTLQDSQGEYLAYANSIWVLVDTQTGRFEKLTPADVEAYEQNEKFPMDYAPRKIRLPKEWEKQEDFAVTRADIDTNGHVNNARYVDMAFEYLDEGKEPVQLRVEYRKAAVFGNRIYPKVHREGNRMTVALCDQAGQVYVPVEIETA